MPKGSYIWRPNQVLSYPLANELMNVPKSFLFGARASNLQVVDYQWDKSLIKSSSCSGLFLRSELARCDLGMRAINLPEGFVTDLVVSGTLIAPPHRVR